MSKWIDYQAYDYERGGVGHTGYLVETIDTSTGRTSFSLRDRPLRTNQSNEPRLFSWCGEDNSKSRTARGVWRVVRLNSASDRAQIVELTGAERSRFLDEDGYPELDVHVNL